MELMDSLMDIEAPDLSAYTLLKPNLNLSSGMLRSSASNVISYDEQPEAEVSTTASEVKSRVDSPQSNGKDGIKTPTSHNNESNVNSYNSSNGNAHSSPGLIGKGSDVAQVPAGPKELSTTRYHCHEHSHRRNLIPRSRKEKQHSERRNHSSSSLPPTERSPGSPSRRDTTRPAIDSYRPYYSKRSSSTHRQNSTSRSNNRRAGPTNTHIDSTGDTEMADHITRPRGGGRGYNNRNNRKRHREDDDYDREPQRRKIEEPAFVKVRRRVLQLGDSGAKLPVTETQEVASKIAENYNDPEVKKGVLDLILQFCVEQPLKIPIMAALCQYANHSNSEISAELLIRAGKQAQAALEVGSWREFKLLMRFLACCQPLYNDDGVFGILDELFNSAAELQAASSADTIGLEIVKIILLTIPYVLASTATGLEQKAAELLEKTGIVASTPHALESLVEPYHGGAETETFHRGSEDRPYSYKSLLSLLQEQIQQEANKGWELPFILRAYVKPDAPETADGEAADAAPPLSQHPFPSITMPNPVSQGPKALFPEAFYSIYADQEIETVPKTTELVGTLVRDTLIDTINILDFNRHQVAKFLIDMDNFWAPGTFVKRATPFDKLRDLPEGESTWKPEDVAIDALFSQIFVLPSAEHKLVYYHSIITESCKIAPAAIAPSLGRAIRFLFRNLDGMDMELSARFMDWFAHHLSNFEFRWKWTEWTDDLTRPAIDPKKAFIVGALDKEIRLSFAKRIRSTLPEEYHHLITEAKEKDTPDFKYNDDRTPYATFGRELLALIRKKAPEETVDIVMNQIHDEAAEHNVRDVHVPSTDAYVTCILFVGSKSLSHALSIIDRCKERLLATPEPARTQIVQSVVDYWAIHPGTAVSIIDKLLNYTILSPMHVIQWALGPERLKEGKLLSLPWVYEMVSSTMHKVTSRVRQIAAARLQVSLPAEQIRMLDDKVTEERQSMRELFAVIADATQGLAAGAADGYMEAVGANDVSTEEAELLRAWGARWNRVFARKGAVEEAVVGEAVMETRVREAEEALEALSRRKKAEAEAEAEAAAKAEANGNGDVDMDTATGDY